MGLMVVLLGLAVLFQFILTRMKWNQGHYADVVVDLAITFILNIIFGSTILGVVSATAGGTLVSLYLIWYPLKIFDRDTISFNKLSTLHDTMMEPEAKPPTDTTPQQQSNPTAPIRPTPTPNVSLAKRFDSFFE